MARNNQVTRQWHLLRRLEGPRGATLQELAGGLPTDMSRHLRTLRRDLDALEAAGFPLVTERVDGSTRWRLMDGFRRVPALSFSATEIMALVLGRDLLKPLEGTQLKAAVDSALAKITSALPPSGLDFVRQMREFFSVGLGPHKSYVRHREMLERLSRAVAERRTVQMRYYSASRGRVTRREVDPYHLWFAAGALYLIAYCHLRRDVRMFAVERIRSLTVTSHPSSFRSVSTWRRTWRTRWWSCAGASSRSSWLLTGPRPRGLGTGSGIRASISSPPAMGCT